MQKSIGLEKLSIKPLSPYLCTTMGFISALCLNYNLLSNSLLFLMTEFKLTGITLIHMHTVHTHTEFVSFAIFPTF